MGRRRHENFVPRHVQHLHCDLLGRPIPFYMRWIDDHTPDLDFIDAGKLTHCVTCGLCWICGETIPKSQQVGFTVTSTNALQRIATEPPQHVDCAEWAARVWPMAVTRSLPPFLKLQRYSGLLCVWITHHYHRPIKLPDGLYRFDLGAPRRVIWVANGRELSRDEGQESMKQQIAADARQYVDVISSKQTGRKVLILQQIMLSFEHQKWKLLPDGDSYFQGSFRTGTKVRRITA